MSHNHIWSQQYVWVLHGPKGARFKTLSIITALHECFFCCIVTCQWCECISHFALYCYLSMVWMHSACGACWLWPASISHWVYSLCQRQADFMLRQHSGRSFGFFEIKQESDLGYAFSLGFAVQNLLQSLLLHTLYTVPLDWLRRDLPMHSANPLLHWSSPRVSNLKLMKETITKNIFQAGNARLGNSASPISSLPVHMTCGARRRTMLGASWTFQSFSSFTKGECMTTI